jgi:hypothetical protein
MYIQGEPIVVMYVLRRLESCPDDVLHILIVLVLRQHPMPLRDANDIIMGRVDVIIT